MIALLSPSSQHLNGRSEALQRVVTATLSAVFVLVFLLLLDNVLLQQLKTRVLDSSMERMQTVQRMNYQAMLQWFGHQSRQLAFWSGSPQLHAVLAAEQPDVAKALGLRQLMEQALPFYPELRDIAIIDHQGLTLLSANAALMGTRSPMAGDPNVMRRLRDRGMAISTLFIVSHGATHEHRVQMALALDAQRFVAISLSPDGIYSRGPAGADKGVTNYLVDSDRRLYRFDRAVPQGKPFLVAGDESWFRRSGISWPSIRHLQLDEGHVEWREPYSGVDGEQVIGHWSWHSEMGVGLLSEIRTAEALDFHARVRNRVIVVTVITAVMFAAALVITAVLHIRLFGTQAPGVVLRLWLRLWPWPWPVTMLVFAAVVGTGMFTSLREFAAQGENAVNTRLDSALQMTVRALDVWRELELANVRLWAGSPLVIDAAADLAAGKCTDPAGTCQSLATLRRYLTPLVRRDDHYGFDVLAADGTVLGGSDDATRLLPHPLAADPQWLARALADGAAVSGVLLSVIPLPADHGEYRPAQPALFVIAPVKNSAGRLLAYLVLHVDPRAGFFRASEMSRFGTTGDAYLVNDRGELLSRPRLDAGSDASLSPATLLLGYAHSKPPAETTVRYRDYRGVDVVGRAHFDVMLGAYIVNKVDVREAFAPSRSVLRALLLIAVVSITAFAGALSAQYLSLRQRMEFQLNGAQPRRDVWSRWGSHPQLMSTAAAVGVFFIDVAIVALMSRFELGDSRVSWFATAAMLTALMLPFIHLLILKPATHANVLLSQLLARSAEQEERYRTISEQLASANEALQHLAEVDQLTGIANRRHLDNVLQYEIDRCQRSHQPLAVLLLDVDHFKAYNDNYGHIEGDRVLQQIGTILKQCITRSTDLVARYGGEEFCIILPNTGADNAVDKADSVLAAIEAANIAHAHSPVAGHITMSIGVFAEVPDPRDNIVHFYQQADRALYRAKHAGRNQVQLVSDE